MNNRFNAMDAGVMLSFARQQSHVLNSQVYDIEYPEMDLRGLIPINTNIPQWASGMDTFVMDKVGRAAWQSTYAKDVPLADVTMTMVSTTFAEYAVGYQWNIGELGKAQFSNFPLTTRRAESARFASELFVYENALIGDPIKGWTGLLNNAQAQVSISPATGSAAPNSAWVLNDGTGNKTPEEILSEVNVLIMGPPNGELGVVTNLLADTVLLPSAAYTYISTTPFGVTSPGKTILQAIMESNVYTQRTGHPLTIRELPVLATQAELGIVGGGRAVAYRNDASVLELPMPMIFQFYPVYQDGPFNFTVPGMGRIGQLDLKRPALRYLDGITPVPPALASLTLATTTATAGVAWTSNINGETTGSIVSATSSDGTVLTVTGGNASVGGTFATAGAKTITLVERLGWNTKTSMATVTVS